MDAPVEPAVIPIWSSTIEPGASALHLIIALCSRCYAFRIECMFPTE